MREKTVLCYLNRGNEYLFLHRNKRMNDLNEGKWIGVGGHIEEGETKEAALKREIKEETGLDINSYILRGEIIFQNDDYEEIMFLFTSNDFSGNLIECDEGSLCWIKREEIMNLNLWEGDKYFLPKLINSKDFIRLTLIYKNKELTKVIDNNGEEL